MAINSVTGGPTYSHSLSLCCSLSASLNDQEQQEGLDQNFARFI